MFDAVAPGSRSRRARLRPRRLPGQRRARPRRSASAGRRARSPQASSPQADLGRRRARVEIAGPGFINLTLSDDVPRPRRSPTMAADARLGVPPATAPETRGRRLLGAERRQGDARRPPALDDHRRRARARCSTFAGPRRDPREPHRRLGHAVRDADRAPARHRRRPRRRASSASATSTRSTSRPAPSSTTTPAFAERARRARRAAAGAATPRRSQLWQRARRRARRATSTTRLRPARRAADRRRHRRRELLQRRCCRRRRRARREAGCCVESDGAMVRLPAGLHQPRGRAAAAHRAQGRRRLRLRRDRPRRDPRTAPDAAARDLARVRRRRAAGAAPRDGVRRWREMAGWLAPPARGEHVAFGNVLGERRQDAADARRARRVRLADLLDEAVERAPAAVAEKKPRARRRRRARRDRARRRHRRGQVRRPVERPGQGLRLRLGPDARVRRQHRAVPAVRARPDPLDLPARRAIDPASAASGVAPTLEPPRSARSPSRSLGFAPAVRDVGRAPRARTGSARTCSTWPAPSRRSTRPARCSRPRPTPSARQPPRAVRRHRPHAGAGPRAARHRGAGAHVSGGVVVHLVDGTYELFRHFYGRRARRHRPPARRRERRAAHRARDAREGAHARRRRDRPRDRVVPQRAVARYKTGAGIDPALRLQFEPLEEALRAMGVAVWPMVEFEADDALAAAARIAAADDAVDQVCIWTPDKDLAQCVSGDRVVQVDRRAAIVRNEDGVREKFGVDPAPHPRPARAGRRQRRRLPGHPRHRHGRCGAADQRARRRSRTSRTRVLGERRELALLFKDLATLRSEIELLADIDAAALDGADRHVRGLGRRARRRPPARSV